MEIIPIQYGYLLGTIGPLLFWLFLYRARKDLRKEMLTMSLLIGVVSVLTSYYWWTADWWRPLTITNTVVGVEDFLIGFASGGIMAVLYEYLFKKKLFVAKKNDYIPEPLAVLLLLAFSTAFLIWGIGLASFVASIISMFIMAIVMFYYRRDLFFNGIVSGAVIVVVMFLISYYPIILLSPRWVEYTYIFKNLSGILVTGIPVEELVFWFFAGMVFGPFYEYWKNKKLEGISSIK